MIVSRKLFVPYDERFRGYGMNKCIQIKAMQLLSKGRFRVVPRQYLIAPCHDRSLSHQLTYSPDAKLRRVIIAKLYELASNDLRSGVMPTLSQTSKQLFDCPTTPIQDTKSNLTRSQSGELTSTPSSTESCFPDTPKVNRFSSFEMFSQKLQKIFSTHLSRFETQLFCNPDLK